MKFTKRSVLIAVFVGAVLLVAGGPDDGQPDAVPERRPAPVIDIPIVAEDAWKEVSPRWSQLPVAVPENAVEHMAAYGIDHEPWPYRGDRQAQTIVRAGDAAKVEVLLTGERDIHFMRRDSHFKVANRYAQFTAAKGRNGRLKELTIGNGRPRIAKRWIAETGEVRTILGETCRVTLARENDVGTHSRYGFACVTDDGVILRFAEYKPISDKPGKAEEYRAYTAKSVVRGISRSKALPPCGLLDWDGWKRLAGVGERLAKKRYRVTLANGDDQLIVAGNDRVSLSSRIVPVSLVGEERAGLWNEYRAGNLNAEYRDGYMRLAFDEWRSLTGFAAPGRAVDRPPEKVLGRTCHWQIDVLELADYGRTTCRAASGAPLLMQETGWGDLTEWRASDLEEGGASRIAVDPPAELFDWSSWGWPTAVDVKGRHCPA